MPPKAPRKAYGTPPNMPIVDTAHARKMSNDAYHPAYDEPPRGTQQHGNSRSSSAAHVGVGSGVSLNTNAAMTASHSPADQSTYFAQPHGGTTTTDPSTTPESARPYGRFVTGPTREPDPCYERTVWSLKETIGEDMPMHDFVGESPRVRPDLG